MITAILSGDRISSQKSFLRAVALFLLIVATTGCPRIVSMDYQPTNPLKGQGTVWVAPFHYQPAAEAHVRPRQVESDPASKSKLYLSQEIGVFFSNALRLELGRSGYSLEEKSPRIVSGTITRFYLDWKSEQDRSFELIADYRVQSREGTLFTWHCTSMQKGPNMLAEDGILIREGIVDCMHRFIAAAQEGGAF